LAVEFFCVLSFRASPALADVVAASLRALAKASQT
jgi:hypothetical protein